ncbi:MAG: acyltransferase [Acidimicrobiales bacterium]
MSVAARGFGVVRGAGSAAVSLRQWARRRWLLLELQVRATWWRSTVKCRISPRVVIGRGVRFEVAERTSSTVVIEAHCDLGDGLLVNLRGGALAVGQWTTFRRNCQLEVVGRLAIGDQVLVQHGTTVHCDESVTIGARTVLSEYTTVVDSRHASGDDARRMIDVVQGEPVVIGSDVWLGAKATVARGVTIGDGAVVSANSLVVKDVPPRWLVSGVPAQPVRHGAGAPTSS